MLPASVSNYIARLRRGIVEAPVSVEFVKGWAEPVSDADFIKGITLRNSRLSGRRDYLGMTLVADDAADEQVQYEVWVRKVGDERVICFLKKHRQYGTMIRVLSLNGNEKVANYSSIIFTFLNGGHVCSTLKKLPLQFLPASSQAAALPRRLLPQSSPATKSSSQSFRNTPSSLRRTARLIARSTATPPIVSVKKTRRLSSDAGL